MNFTSADRIIVSELVKSQAVDLYEIHKKYLLSPAQLVDTIARLKAIGVIDDSELELSSIKLTSQGLSVLMSYRAEIFHRLNEWKEVPSSMTRATLAVNSPYIPNYRKLGSKLKSRQKEIRKELKAREYAG